MCESPIKLCVYERDFLTGLHIKDNITDGITKSNSAIIVMFQAFYRQCLVSGRVYSMLSRKQKDPVFKIFMITI